MKALRAAADFNPELKDEWNDSVQDPMILLSTIFQRLNWNNENIEVCMHDHSFDL